MKDKVAEVLGLSDISPAYPQQEIQEPDIIKTYRKLSVEKSQTDGYCSILLAYRQSWFRDFKSYFRVSIPLDVIDIQLILKTK